MGGRGWVCVLLGFGWANAALGQATAQALSPAEAIERMVLPPGFRVERVASEPDIRQPVAACFDERGRLWVIEYLQYPTPAGLKPVEVDQYLRTKYDRVPEPPPKGPRGADRIKILEDTDGDGQFETVKTFVEGLNLASGLAVGRGGVFVGQAPYLLFYPDRDRDDVPDGDPEVLLTGFGLEDAHATVNSLAWGPDGWLYGAQGSTVTANIRGVGFQQGIWRYEPGSDRFELFAEGGGNTWGLDFDRGGNAFGSSNGGFIAFHMVQGGYYWKGFAKHGPLHNPRTFGYFDAIAYDGPKVGGHVTPGGIIYKGDNFPSAFQGRFIGANLLSNAVYWHELEPAGSTLKGRHGGTLLEANDPWFRPIDLLTGPDGCVYVVDWYDIRASHLDPRDNWDKSNGRIYRVVYEERDRVEPFDLTAWTDQELLGLRAHPNDWWPETARRVLRERGANAELARELKKRLAEDTEEEQALRDLWMLDAVGGLDRETAMRLLDHSVAWVRRWSIRRLGDDWPLEEGLTERLKQLATNETDAGVRSQLVSSLGRWKVPGGLEILGAMMEGNPDDSNDAHLPLQMWWVLERAQREDAATAHAWVRGMLGKGSAVLAGHLVERYARALGESGLKDAGELLHASKGMERVKVLRGLDQGLAGRGGKVSSVPSELSDCLGPLMDDPEAGVWAMRVGARLGEADALTRVMRRAADEGVGMGERVELVGVLAASRTDGARLGLLMLLGNEDAPEALRTAALDGVVQNETEAGLIILEELPKWSVDLRRRGIDHLTRREAWAKRLLDEIAEGKIEAKELSVTQARQIQGLGDAALSARLEKLWGKLPGADSESRRQRIAEVRGMLPEGDKGNPARGVAIFEKQCAGCHTLFGKGEAIGPDLTGTQRGDLEFLLQSVVDPSAVIRNEYAGQTLALSDGRVLSGLLVEETAGSVTLFDSQKVRTVVSRDLIEETRPAEVSLMPEGLIDGLKDEEIRDLFRYLQASGPPGP